jgi:polyhydroxybutyrate depolymerase
MTIERSKSSAKCALLCTLFLPVSGCGESSGGVAGGSGGVAGGAQAGSGASIGSGAAVGSGGVTATGGSIATGGSAATGGSTSSGGSPASGGTAPGGATGSGGVLGTGGAPSTGGGGAGPGGAGGSSGMTTCPSPALKAGDTNKTIQIGAQSRAYVLHVPAMYDGSKPVPLVVDFHPLGGSGPSERSGSPYPAQTDPEGVVMAFPSGLAGPAGGAWNVGPCCVKDVDDVAFAKALVADVEKVACIDTKRVYAVGFSMGGGMSHYVACHAADVFAAVAPAAFDLLKENQDDCKPPRSITVVSFRGTSDPIVPYQGGYSAVVSGMPITFLGAKGTMDKWAQIDGCTGAASAADSNNCSTYSACQDGVQVTLCTKQGGGHEPGNASVAWPILKKYTLP